MDIHGPAASGVDGGGEAGLGLGIGFGGITMLYVPGVAAKGMEPITSQNPAAVGVNPCHMKPEFSPMIAVALSPVA
jgi:hypothetical protein